MRAERDLVRVLGVVPELTAELDPRTAELVRRKVVAEVDELGVGRWHPRGGDGADGLLGLLVIDGVLTRSVRLGARRGTELLGPGDLLRPWDVAPEEATLPSAAEWRVIAPARVAVLDGYFATTVARWPSIVARLLGLTLRRSRALALQMAIAQVPRLEERLLLVLWQLADRFGRVDRDGVRVPLRLSHELLSELVCARRPSVTVALKTLRARGLVDAANGGWLLAHDSLDGAVAALDRPGRSPACAVAEGGALRGAVLRARKAPDERAGIAS